MADKVFVGEGWQSKYGISLSLKLADLNKLPTNKYGDIFVEVKERKEPNAKSKATHYVCKDDYRYGKLGEAPKEDSGLAMDDTNSLPF
jgi:hypothetical protein